MRAAPGSRADAGWPFGLPSATASQRKCKCPLPSRGACHLCCHNPSRAIVSWSGLRATIDISPAPCAAAFAPTASPDGAPANSAGGRVKPLRPVPPPRGRRAVPPRGTKRSNIHHNIHSNRRNSLAISRRCHRDRFPVGSAVAPGFEAARPPAEASVARGHGRDSLTAARCHPVRRHAEGFCRRRVSAPMTGASCPPAAPWRRSTIGW